MSFVPQSLDVLFYFFSLLSAFQFWRFLLKISSNSEILSSAMSHFIISPSMHSTLLLQCFLSPVFLFSASLGFPCACLLCHLFLNALCFIHQSSQHINSVCCADLSLSHVQFSVTPWTVARQAPLSMGFSR